MVNNNEVILIIFLIKNLFIGNGDTESIIDLKNPLASKPYQASRQPTTSKQQRFQRTMSESSTESNYNTLNSSSMNKRHLMHYKPGLFNNLKRLNNEKLILVSNNSPLGIFSRLPFRLATYK